MANLKELADEMAKLKKQFETVLSVSDYYNCEDLSGLDDYMQINTAEQWQQLEEFRHILNQIDEIESTLAYLERPIQEVSRIYINGTGRYETGKGHYYVSGSGIEFLRNEKVYNYGEDIWETVGIWTCSRVESRDGKYYIVGHPDVEMSGLTVRVRG
jgi:hypothetical protein